jgi:microcystin-dependent protein
MDVLRNCYEAWMRVPEYAEPIRIRWYKVPTPAPGSYELTDYCSSNYDSDPKSLDPGVGEQSSTRDPWRDWRDCSPPPWTKCDALPNGGCDAYVLVSPQQIAELHYTATGILYRDAVDPCLWDGLVRYGGGEVGAEIRLHDDGTWGLLFVLPRSDWVPLSPPWTGGRKSEWRNPADPLLRVYLYCLKPEDDMPIGSITAFGGAAAPNGWLLCDGSLHNIADWPALYAVLGTTFGGDGLTTFGVPDLRGRVPMGVAGSHPLGQQLGEETHLLTLAEMPAHSHPLTDPGHHHASLGAASAFVCTTSPGGTLAAPAAGAGAQLEFQTEERLTGVTEAVVGGGLAHNVIQPSLALTYIVRGA